MVPENVKLLSFLPPMPLFLAPGQHVKMPLEASYMAAVSKIPQRARKPLEG